MWIVKDNKLISSDFIDLISLGEVRFLDGSHGENDKIIWLTLKNQTIEGLIFDTSEQASNEYGRIKKLVLEGENE